MIVICPLCTCLRSFRPFAKEIQNLVVEGLMDVNGRHHIVQSCRGVDLKLLDGWLGLCGCSSKYPCIYCKARKWYLFMTKSAWDPFGGLSVRTIQDMSQMAHVVSDYEYVCHAHGAFQYHSIAIYMCVCV
jgi:hypothetical protein